MTIRGSREFRAGGARAFSARVSSSLLGFDSVLGSFQATWLAGSRQPQNCPGGHCPGGHCPGRQLKAALQATRQTCQKPQFPGTGSLNPVLPVLAARSENPDQFHPPDKNGKNYLARVLEHLSRREKFDAANLSVRHNRGKTPPFYLRCSLKSGPPSEPPARPSVPRNALRGGALVEPPLFAGVRKSRHFLDRRDFLRDTPRAAAISASVRSVWA